MGFATVTAEGLVELPEDIRREWNLKPGDKVEFYKDRLGELHVRRHNRGPLDFLEGGPKRKRRPDITSDDDAIAAAMVERHPPARKKARTG